MKTRYIALASVLCLGAACPAFAAPPPAAAKKPVADTKSQHQEFPLQFKGKEIVISRQAKRAELEPMLTKILGEKTALADKDTLQYDVQLDPEQAPVSVVLSWNKNGNPDQIRLGAYEEIQNPPAKELKRWLTKNAGPGKTTKNKKAETTTITWNHQGWQFVFTQGGDGEDSTYSFEITPLKTK